ncbi:iron-responsive element-binding protein 2 isoform X1 [Anguilla rostrata]|uniref:iron-responsive element-binding protein 2 isoform X1 n=1 Tax=Anguilla rostrata TaxID=7938 RepID=UPI0030D2F4F1
MPLLSLSCVWMHLNMLCGSVPSSHGAFSFSKNGAATWGHPFSDLIDTLKGEKYGDKKYFSPQKLNDQRYDALPLSIRVLLEASIRKCDGFYVKKEDVYNILDWQQQQQSSTEIPFAPARVLLQDFTGIPAMVDLAAMRDAVASHGGDPNVVNPSCPTDLVVDHSLQIDFSKCAIQNAPNPGGGEGHSTPIKSPPGRGAPLRGSQCGRPSQRGCRKGACSDAPATSGRPGAAVQIENTPLLCPFHLQPVSEPETALKNQEMELMRNKERLQFFKWCSKAFKNVNVVPPDTGAIHQVNLEYLSQVVQERDGFVCPDSVVGTDSHTTMINGLGILGWGVGGIESEAVMLGQPVSLTLPQVVGCKLVGSISTLATSIDIVLGITKHLRQAGIAGKFVEFFGPGVSQLSVPDRTTIANMCPEYSATVSFFPVDDVTLKHFKQTNLSEEKLELLEAYLKAVKLFRTYQDPSEDPQYSEVIEINLGSIVPHVSGPKRPQDRVAVSNMKTDFLSCLNEKVGFKGFHVPAEKQATLMPFVHEGQEYKLAQGSVVIAAIISCTNNCNPSVMLAAGLLAKKAVAAGLAVRPYIRTSLAPGSGMVTHYLSASGVLPSLGQLGFEVIGYGCATCVGNTAPLPDSVVDAIKQGDLVVCGVLSGNRHFEGRLCNCVRANYLASPPLVVAYAIAGTVDIDFETEPLGVNSDGKEVYLREVWPSREEVQHTERHCVIASMFRGLKLKMEKGNRLWNNLEAPESELFPWDPKSTYIRCPPFFNKLTKEPPALQSIDNAHALLFLGDTVTTDHISPAGSIARVSPAAKYLLSKRLTPREFNSYGARRGNDAVMTRGTFASIKLQNRFISKTGPKTVHIPSGQTLDVFEAADRYQKEGIPLVILAGRKYGSGSSRDWAAKGPYLLGVRAVIAESFEKMHRNHLVGMGIAPLQFLPGESADSLELCGKEKFSVSFPEDLSPRQELTVKTSSGKAFRVIVLFESEMDIVFFRHGGILRFVARTLTWQS